MKPPSTQDLTKFLQHYLEVNYSEKASDLTFIAIRGKLAKDRFESIYANTRDYDLSYELAMDILLHGYLFSKYEFISNIISSKFRIIHSNKNAKKKCIEIIDKCAPIFRKYTFTDDMLHKKNVIDLENEITNFSSSLSELQDQKK